MSVSYTLETQMVYETVLASAGLTDWQRAAVYIGLAERDPGYRLTSRWGRIMDRLHRALTGRGPAKPLADPALEALRQQAARLARSGCSEPECLASALPAAWAPAAANDDSALPIAA